MGELSFFSILYIALCYTAVVVFFGGMAFKLWGYAVTPSPLKIPTTPQPITKINLILKNLVDITVFSSLFRGNRWTWIGGYALHIILLFILIRHLRFFVQPVTPALALLQPFGMYAGLLLPLPLIYLFVRRLTVDRMAYISSWADMFALILFFLIGVSGIGLKLIAHPDLVAVKHFLLGLVLFSPVNVPTQSLFLFHFTLVLVLAFYFPFSKLLHAGGVFFSPTKTQLDNTRETRYENPWTKNVT
jgi:nitrate reductase gamma subunit